MPFVSYSFSWLKLQVQSKSQENYPFSLLPSRHVSHEPCDYITCELFESTPPLHLWHHSLTLTLIISCLDYSNSPIFLSSISFAQRNLSSINLSVHAFQGKRDYKLKGQAIGRYCEWVKQARIWNEVLFLLFFWITWYSSFIFPLLT